MITVKTDGELSGGTFVITKKDGSAAAILFRSIPNLLEVYDDYPILINDISFYKNKAAGENLQKAGSAVKYTSIMSSAASVYLSPNVALLVVKSIQVFDYIRLINVERPENLD